MAANQTSFKPMVNLEDPIMKAMIVNGAVVLQRGQWVRHNALQKGRFLGVKGNRIVATAGDGKPYSMNRDFEWARANGY